MNRLTLVTGFGLAWSIAGAQAPSPHGLGVEDTYTITTIMKVARPCRPEVMTDAYQDVKVLSDDGTCYTLSVTYFPLVDNVRKLRSEAYSSKPGDLKGYLRPTVTCNWDATMREKLMAQLRLAGIDSAKLKPAELVSRVASWAFQTSSFAPNTSAMPSDWFVSFGDSKPQVYAPTRSDFLQSKTETAWTDQDVFNHQLFGRQMFENRSHGACTSSSIYLATILRALGVPTRILYFIPPCDGNDARQVKLLSDAISRRATRQPVMDGVRLATGFANHMYNEVWIEGRWQRLNYNKLGQEIVDSNYLGMMTHIDTCADISETHLAETWGQRASKWPNVQPKLSSVNPYQLVAASDHWGRNAIHDDPVVQELTKATVIATLWPGTPAFQELIPDGQNLPKTDLFLSIREWIDGRNYVQLREFIHDADPRFLLRAPGHPDVPLHYNGLNCNNSSKRGFAFVFDAKPVTGVSYKLVPLNQSGSHKWAVADGLVLIGQ